VRRGAVVHRNASYRTWRLSAVRVQNRHVAEADAVGCPQCGGDVAGSIKGGVTVDGVESWSETGRCSTCGESLRRSIGPSGRPVAHMKPFGPWELAPR
jgi:hypothetical protein